MKFKNKNAQSMVEFVILIPLLFILFIGIFQFTLIMLTKIKLAIVEHEIVVFLTSENENYNNVNVFLKEIADKYSLKNKNISISKKESKNKVFSETNAQKNPLEKINFLSKFKGETITIIYKMPLMKIFSKITGKNFINLQTSIYTGIGGSFRLTAKKLFGKEDANMNDYIEEEYKGIEE